MALAQPGHGEGVHLTLERMRESLEPPFSIDRESLRVQTRTGAAFFPADAESADTLLANAEAALNAAKRAGEPYMFYARQMNARVAEMLKLENELRIAVREEQFVLHYQPRISLATKVVSGMEALIRWRHPQRGLVSPADFIPLLEESGLILDVGRWALRRAAADAARWRALCWTPPPIGVNVSAIQLRQKDFVEDVMTAIEAGASATQPIEIELTESMLMSDVESNVRKLDDLRAAGIKIAMDDFGTGYSSLSYLVRLPVDALKVDRSFIASMSASPMHMAIVSTVISLAHGLNLSVVAEGVEMEEQANLLRLLRCDEAQGFLYSRPLPFEEVAAACQQIAR
jgi:EAL domain-containing protein (putative c-di-GMP-specific phosphodiesterase class I)